MRKCTLTSCRIYHQSHHKIITCMYVCVCLYSPYKDTRNKAIMVSITFPETHILFMIQNVHNLFFYFLQIIKLRKITNVKVKSPPPQQSHIGSTVSNASNKCFTFHSMTSFISHLLMTSRNKTGEENNTYIFSF